MAIDSVHPQYSDRLADWVKMSDCYAGERQVKEMRTVYLPATAGQESRGLRPDQPGRKAYDAYLLRSVFPDFVSQAVEAMVGIMHHKPPVIELPDALEPLRENATVEGEGLEVLLRKINEAQLTTGRYGMLLDVPDGAAAGVLPYIAPYRAHAIRNWDNGTRDGLVKQNLNLVVLEESEYERQDNFEWEFETKYRVAIVGDEMVNEPARGGLYRVGVFRDNENSFSEGNLITPSIAGRTLDFIPFVFVNACDMVPKPDKPPLLGLADLALTVYRGEADYRQALYNQGQDTLVVIGGTEDEYTVGAGAHINVVQGGDAKYIGVDSQGLPEMRSALENDRQDAADIGGRLLDNRGGEEASGNALAIRVSARTASVKQIALTGAASLQQILRYAAEWVGADPEQVIVTPNMDFVDEELSGRTLLEYVQAKTLGAPFSNESIHMLMRRKGLTKKAFEEEIAALEDEDQLTGGDGTGVEEE